MEGGREGASRVRGPAASASEEQEQEQKLEQEQEREQEQEQNLEQEQEREQEQEQEQEQKLAGGEARVGRRVRCGGRASTERARALAPVAPAVAPAVGGL